jgi:hypothetical protein
MLIKVKPEIPEATNSSEMKNFENFCEETSLHGWSYLNNKMNKFWKMIWMLFIFLIIGTSIYVIEMNIKSYLQATTVTTIDSTIASLKDVTFPSIYICNINQVSVLANINGCYITTIYISQTNIILTY